MSNQLPVNALIDHLAGPQGQQQLQPQQAPFWQGLFSVETIGKTVVLGGVSWIGAKLFEFAYVQFFSKKRKSRASEPTAEPEEEEVEEENPEDWDEENPDEDEEE